MKVLFISTEVWSTKNPEGIVCRKLVNGLLENNCILDIISTNKTEIDGLNKEHIVNLNSHELLSKIQKKIIGVEKKDFVNYVKRNAQKFDFSSYDLVITRSEPFFVHEIGFYIKSTYPHVKWVASFGDPVFLNPYNSSSIIKKKVAKKLETKYWNIADLVTHTNSAVIEAYQNNNFNINKAIVLENPFILSKQTEIKREFNEPIRFGYIGSLYGKRKIDPVIKFLSNVDFDYKLFIIGGVRNTYYENRFGSITKFLMKKDKETIMRPIRNFGVEEKVEFIPFMDKISLDSFIDSNIDVLINIDAPIGDKNIFLSSKVVEYLQYKMPILNFSIEGASVDLLKKVGVDLYYDLHRDTNFNLKLIDLPSLIPSKNVEYFTSNNVIYRLLNKVNSL